MNSVTTYTATIYVGLREGYDRLLHDLAEVEVVCQDYVNAVGLCVTITPTTFVYTQGREPGAAVGLIHYPRFPSTPAAIRQHARVLGERLRQCLGQQRVSVVCSDGTDLLGDPDNATPKAV